jgi:hypothetical protein
MKCLFVMPALHFGGAESILVGHLLSRSRCASLFPCFSFVQGFAYFLVFFG